MNIVPLKCKKPEIILYNLNKVHKRRRVTMNRNFLIRDGKVLNLHNCEFVDLSDNYGFDLYGDCLYVRYSKEDKIRHIAGLVGKLYDSNMNLIVEDAYCDFCTRSARDIQDVKIKLNTDDETYCLDYKGNVFFKYKKEDCVFYDCEINRLIKTEKGDYKIFDHEYLTDLDGKRISKKYSQLSIFYKYNLIKVRNFLSYKDGSKYGVIDSDGNEIIPCDYNALEEVSSNLDIPLFIGRKPGATVIINSKNEIISEIDFDMCRAYYDKPKWPGDHFITEPSLFFEKDKMILKYYTAVMDINDYGTSCSRDVIPRSICYIINNEEIINIASDISNVTDTRGSFFEDISRVGDYYLIRNMDGKEGLIAEDGKIIVECKYDEIYVGCFNTLLLYDASENKFYTNE